MMDCNLSGTWQRKWGFESSQAHQDLPMWRNGSRTALRTRRTKVHGGSSPLIGTKVYACVGELVQPAVKINVRTPCRESDRSGWLSGKPLHWGFESLPHAPPFRVYCQLGRRPGLEPGGWRFNSSHPDQLNISYETNLHLHCSTHWLTVVDGALQHRRWVR